MVTIKSTAGTALLLLSGCALGGPNLETLTYSEQEAAILRVAPVGTSRERALEKLEQAGVVGSFGISESIYYCDIWQRRGGDVSHLDVALLFDEQGNLYETRPGDTEVTFEPKPTDRPEATAHANAPSESSSESPGARR